MAFKDGPFLKCTLIRLFIYSCLFVYLLVCFLVCVDVLKRYWANFPDQLHRSCWLPARASLNPPTSSKYSQPTHSKQILTTRNGEGFCFVFPFHRFRKGHYKHILHFTKCPCFMRPTSTFIFHFFPIITFISLQS